MTVLVASLEGTAGKTAVALALARAAEERGERAGYMKPKGSSPGSTVGGTRDARDGDPALARELLDVDADGHEMVAVVYSSSLVREILRGREDPDALRGRVRERFESLADGRDRMVLEGGDSPTAGGTVGLTDADVADLLEATVVLLADYETPDDVDDVIAAADLLGNRLGGVLFNAVSDAAFDPLASDVVPFLEGRGIRVFGAVPRETDLLDSGRESDAETVARMGELLAHYADVDAMLDVADVGGGTPGTESS